MTIFIFGRIIPFKWGLKQCSQSQSEQLPLFQNVWIRSYSPCLMFNIYEVDTLEQYLKGWFKNEKYPIIYSPSSDPTVYDFLLLDKYIWSYIKNVLALSSFIMVLMSLEIMKSNKVCPSIIKSSSHSAGMLLKAFWSELMHLCWKNIHI